MYYSESDESDQEWISSSSRLYSENEIDVAILYKKLCSGNIFNNPNRKLKRSVAVQTEPEIGNIPPSWLLAGERLIDELYTGLGNVINTMYHSHQVLSSEEIMPRAGVNHAKSKYFVYENGYWKSTLLPSIKIPDSSVTRLNSPLYSEDTRKNLKNLLQTATQLRCIIPFLSDLATCKDQQTVDEKIQSFFNRDQTQDSPKSNPTPDSDTSDSDMVIDNLSEDEMRRPVLIVGQRPPAPRQPRPAVVVDSLDSCGISDGNPVPKLVRKEWGQRDPLIQDPLGLRFGSDEIPGLKMSRFAHCQTYDSCNRSKKAQKLREKDLNVDDCASRRPVDQKSGVLASCSNIKPSTGSNQGCTLKVMGKKRINETAENRKETAENRKNIAVASKNFIRKNIMDLKKSNREVRVRTDGSHLEARGSSRNLNALSSCATVCKKQCRQCR